MAADLTVLERTRRQAERLRALRERTGIRKTELCSRLGWESTQTYDLYECAVSVIRLDRVDDWADAFGVSVEELLARVIEDPDPTWDLAAEFGALFPDDETLVTIGWGHPVASTPLTPGYVSRLSEAGPVASISARSWRRTSLPRRVSRGHS